MSQLQDLFTIICQRRDAPHPDSYTSQLLQRGEDQVLKKIGEEAIEIIVAAKGQGNQRLIEEMADLTYHLLVLLALRGLSPAEVEAELRRRHQARQQPADSLD